MNHLIIYAHPSANSFNSAIKATIIQKVEQSNHAIKVRDLYELHFDPVLQHEEMLDIQKNQYRPDVLCEQQHIAWADVIYFIYPTWWYSMPAILKGYCDRVFTNGFAFTSTPDGSKGMLYGKKAFIFETAGDTEHSLLHRNLKQGMMNTMDIGILQYCGIEVLQHKLMPEIHDISDEARQKYLREIGISVEQQMYL
ncbi:MAG: NAD(P)H-dependent oxidoreductase [Bacillus sp. (in: firmicutes)]